VKRTDVTSGQLEQILWALVFTCRVDLREPPTRLCEHQASGALVFLPTFPEDDHVLEYHLVGVRTTLDGYGIADPTAFAKKIQKAG
jgi:hypothetical protein